MDNNNNTNDFGMQQNSVDGQIYQNQLSDQEYLNQQYSQNYQNQQYTYGNQVNQNQQYTYGNQMQTQGMCCPNCGSYNMQVLQETKTSGKDFSGARGCCGYILLGPLGILCGSCGKGKQTMTDSFWLCNQCGS